MSEQHDSAAPPTGAPAETPAGTSPRKQGRRAASNAAYITGDALARRVGCNPSTICNYRPSLPSQTSTGAPMYFEIRRKGGVGWMYAPEAEALIAAKYAQRAEVKTKNAHAARAIRLARVAEAKGGVVGGVGDPALLAAITDLTGAVREMKQELRLLLELVTAPTGAKVS